MLESGTTTTSYASAWVGFQRMLCPAPRRKSSVPLHPSARSRYRVSSRCCMLWVTRRTCFLGGLYVPPGGLGMCFFIFCLACLHYYLNKTLKIKYCAEMSRTPNIAVPKCHVPKCPVLKCRVPKCPVPKCRGFGATIENTGLAYGKNIKT